MIKGLTAKVKDLNMVAMVTELNVIESNLKDWWIDTGASRHVCVNKNHFTTFELVHGEKIYMANAAVASVEGKGTVKLKMTSGKVLTLAEVLYVPEIRKNLVSVAMLNQNGFRIAIESDEVVLSKFGMFIGNGFIVNGLFKMNVMAIIDNEVNTCNPSVYLIESSCLWHGRLGHVNFDSIRQLINLDHIQAFVVDNERKCEVCVEAKLTRSSFPSVQRSTEPLELVHIDVYDLKYVQTRGGNKYFITFIDDSTKYCYVYLLKSKDEDRS